MSSWEIVWCRSFCFTANLDMSMIRPILEYGCQIFDGPGNKAVESIETVQNDCIRIATGPDLWLLWAMTTENTRGAGIKNIDCKNDPPYCIVWLIYVCVGGRGTTPVIYITNVTRLLLWVFQCRLLNQNAIAELKYFRAFFHWLDVMPRKFFTACVDV